MSEDNNIEQAISEIFLQLLENPKMIEALKEALHYNSGKQRNVLQDSKENIQTGELSCIIEKIDRVAKNTEDILNLISQKDNSLKKGHSLDLIRQRDGRGETVDNESLKNEIQELKEQKEKLERKNDELEKKCNDVKTKYQIVENGIEVWEKLKELGNESKEYISNLCGNFEVYACLSLGRDEGKISQLWNFLKEKAMKYDPNDRDVGVVNLYFEFCIQVYNEICRTENQFRSFTQPINSEYNIDKCIKTSDSKQVGVVKKTIVNGYEKNGKIEYKSIVRIE